jgi:hypothetical protein
MPRYLFHLVSDCARVPDREGTDLADAGAACREAFLVAGELVKPGLPAQHRKWHGWSLQLIDQQGAEVLNMPVGELVAGRGHAAAPDRRMSAPTADRAPGEHATSDGVAKSAGGIRTDVIMHTRRLIAEALRQVERCHRVHRAVSAEIELARQTARLSAQLIEQSSALLAAKPTS